MIELPKVFVVPAEGVKIPLPVAGMRIPGTGATVSRTTHIERLLRTMDLLEGEAATTLAATRQAALDAAAKNVPPGAEEAKAPATAMAPPPATLQPTEAKPQTSAAKAEK
jgi:hypothetical protein